MDTTPLRLCIIENGLVPEHLHARFGSYPQMIERWLQPALPEASFSSVSAVRGEALPDPEQFDGYVLSGSKHSCYERSDWMLRLLDFLQRLRDLEKPVFGICFGHQIMADAYAGQTTRADVGWGIGAQAYRFNDSSLADTPTFVFHQDQVSTLPARAKVVGGSAHCPNGALAYDFPALSVQFHPEFDEDYVQALLDQFGGSLVPAPVAEHGRASLRQHRPDNARIARWAARFFREHSAGAGKP